MSIFYVNGEYLPETEAKLPVRDLAILRGYGAFDYLRTYGQQPFRLDKNIARLRRSCEILDLRFPWSDDDLAEIVHETLNQNLALNEGDEYSIRLLVTGGISSSNITPDGDPSLMVLVQPFTPPPNKYYDNGVKLVSVDLNRLFPDAKSTLYTPAILAQKRAREQGGVEALYIDNEGNVLEGTTANIFAVYDNTIVTPPTADNILPGITRMTTIELAEQYFTLEVRPLPFEELLQADEAFITSANREVMPVVEIDEHTIGDGAVGEGTQQMMALFRELTQKRAQGVSV